MLLLNMKVRRFQILCLFLVDEYLNVARNNIPDYIKDKGKEDVLLQWLNYANYDSNEALKTLFENFK